MRVLCCLDGSNSELIGQTVAALAGSYTLCLLYVIDSGPHGKIEMVRARFMRPHELDAPRREQMHQAEQITAQDILAEGLRLLPAAERLVREGRPEREIAICAAEWQADLIILCSRSQGYGELPPGPRAVGHVARFVLDHAPCPVLLVRPRAGKNFSLPGYPKPEKPGHHKPEKRP